MTKNTAEEAPANYSLADALFTSTQQRIYSLLFGQPGRSFYVTEIVGLANIGRGGVQRELLRLEQSGLVTTSRIGNQKHYQANSDSPLYVELVSIVRKTVGLKQPMLEALNPIAEKIVFAFVYGSVAKGTDKSGSDIDLMIVSDKLALGDVFIVLAKLEAQLGRKVNPTLYNYSEFKNKVKSNNSFLSKVLAGPIMELMGSIDGK